MSSTSGLELARLQVDLHSQRIAKVLFPCCQLYTADSPGRRSVRVLNAVIMGVVSVFLFPITCILGMVGLFCYGGGRACYGRKARLFDSPCVGAMFCFLGLVITALYLGASAYGYLNLKQSVGIFLGAITVSVIVKVYFALQNHAPSPPPPQRVLSREFVLC